MTKLTDPGEFDHIRKTYFEGHEPKLLDIDPDERWQRLRAKLRSKKNQSR